MRTQYFLAAIAALSVNMASPAMAQTGEKKIAIKNDPTAFTINVTLKNFTVQPSKVYLYADRDVADSAMVKNGKFSFTGKASEVRTMSIGVPLTTTATLGMQSIDRISLEVMPGIINVVSDKKFNNNTVSGSGAVATLDYRTAMKRVQAKADSAKELLNSEEAKTNPGMALVISNVMGEMMEMMYVDYETFIKAKPNSPMAPKMMEMYLTSDRTTAVHDDSLMQLLPVAAREKLKEKHKDAIAKKIENDRLKAQSDAITAIGVEAKDFTQKDVNGKEVKLSDFRGKYVLIDFWASWCGPCRAENPNVVKAFNAYKDKNFTILGISLDQSAQEEAWKSAIEKDGLTWTQVWDTKGFDNEAAKLYGVKAIPQNFLLDPSGKIIAKNLRGAALEQKLAEVIR